MAYFKRKGCVHRNSYLNCVSLYEDFEKISYGLVSSACNWRRHWPECVRRVNSLTFKLLFYWRDYRAQLFKGRLGLSPGFFFFLQKHFFG